MATNRKQSTVARTGAPVSTADGLIGELQRRADEIMALLTLFGHTLHSHRRAALSRTCPVWGNAAISTIEVRAGARLTSAIKNAARHIRTRKTTKHPECFEEIEDAANECMVLLDLFGSTVIRYRKAVAGVGDYPACTEALAIIIHRGMDSLKQAVEAMRKPLESREG